MKGKKKILILVLIFGMFKLAYNQSYSRFGIDTSGGVVPEGLSVLLLKIRMVNRFIYMIY